MRSSHPDALERVFGRRTLLFAVAIMGALTIGVFALVGVLVFGRHVHGDHGPLPRSRPAIVEAVREVVRLETRQLHVEKVFDLTDKQRRPSGLVNASDALLLVVSAEVTIGIDLVKLRDEDVSLDGRAGAARVRLPPPEILDLHLDEKCTYVHKQPTSSLVERSDRLDSRARAEVTASIERAARETDALERSKRAAERQVRVLLAKLDVERVDVVWQDQP